MDDKPPEDKGAGGAEVNRCLVFCRLRPSFKRDFEDGAHPLLTLTGKKVIVQDERTYEYDGTFQADCEQTDVFSSVALPCIQHAFKGFCSALMCYGQTGTGKSFTMCCTKPGNEGIIPLAAKQIFTTIRRDPSREYTVMAEFIQIYRDQLGDLMSSSGKDRVDIHWDHDEGVTLPGCSQHELTSPEEFMEFYHEGDKRRVVTATAMNPESSRGHTALVVRITSSPKDDEMSGTIRGKITFIDLAGYERFSKTGISNANPIMKDEAKTINASLLSLGHVVTALSNNDKHIPWRNAKLTRLLQDSIGGRSRTTIILTVGPSSDHLHESTNTLQFGMRAMAVKVQAKVSMTVDYEKLAHKLQSMLEEKDARISDLEIQAAANDAERQELLERHRRDQEEMEQHHEGELDRARREGMTAEQILELNRQLALEASTLKEQQEEEVTYHEEKHQRDMLSVFEEEKKRANRDLEQERMMRERAISELQDRLDEARGGGNKDLEHALHELAAREATLASRAQDIARMQDLVERLANQVREAGMEPDSLFDIDAPEMVVDVSQLDEVKARYEKELEATRNQVADLRTALQDASSRAAARGDEVEKLKTQVKDLRSELAAETIDDMLAPSPEASVESPTEPAVDVEALQAAMQSDIDYWRSRATALQEQNDEMKKAATVAQQQETAREKATPRRNTAGGSAAARQEQTELLLKNEKLMTEIALLREQVDAARSTPGGDAAGDESSDSVAIRPQQLERIKATLAAKDTQIEEAYKLIGQRERALNDSKRQVHSLKTQLALGGSSAGAVGVSGEVTNDSMVLGPNSSMTRDTIASEAVSLMEYMEAMDALRRRNTELEKMLLGELSADTLDAIDSRDRELAAKDQRVQEQAAEIEALTSAVARLERQLEDVGEEPICRLDSEKRAVADAALAQNEAELAEQQKALEAERKRRAAEQAKVNSMLQALSQERLEEAALFKQAQDKQRAEYEARLKEQEAEREAHAKEEAERLEAIEKQKAKEEAEAAALRQELMENTRQMMAAQAKLAEEQEHAAESEGFFSRLKRKLRD